MAYKYENGKWVYVYDNPSDTSRPTGGSSGSNSNSGSSSSKPVNKNPSNSSSNYTPPILADTSNRETTESLNTANKDYVEIEQNILQGDVHVIPDPNYKAKHTILMQYLGKNLTGLYFVDKVVHTFDLSGYSQSLTVSRSGFGDSIKKGSASKPVGSVAPSQGGLMNGTSDSSRPSSSTPTPVPPPKPDIEVVNKWATVITVGLNIRSQPDKNSRQVTAMAKGDRCYVYHRKTSNGWLEVEWKNRWGTYKGWCSGYYEYIKID